MVNKRNLQFVLHSFRFRANFDTFGYARFLANWVKNIGRRKPPSVNCVTLGASKMGQFLRMSEREAIDEGF
jgi:hypothetical protein